MQIRLIRITFQFLYLNELSSLRFSLGTYHLYIGFRKNLKPNIKYEILQLERQKY